MPNAPQRRSSASGGRALATALAPLVAAPGATTMWARTEGLEGLGLPMEDFPHGMGRRFASGMAGTAEVPGVWVAGNATHLATADTEAALIEVESRGSFA